MVYLFLSKNFERCTSFRHFLDAWFFWTPTDAVAQEVVTYGLHIRMDEMSSLRTLKEKKGKKIVRIRLNLFYTHLGAGYLTFSVKLIWIRPGGVFTEFNSYSRVRVRV